MTGFNKWLVLFMVLVSGSQVSAEEQTYIVVEQVIPGVVPEMLDWWWDHIDSTDRFVRWAPDQHLSFQKLSEAGQSDPLAMTVGTRQRWEEEVAGNRINRQLTWLSIPSGHPAEPGFHAVRARVDFPDYIGTLGAGRVRFDYRRTDNGLWLRSKYVLPARIDEVFPGYRTALASHIRDSMQNLSTFLPGLFQGEYLEGELLKRGSYQITQTGWLLKKVVVDQEIRGITPDMLDWWWDNINSTERYRRWHPTAHLSFDWQQAPSQPDQLNYAVGAVQSVSEYIGPYKSNLLITWLDPSEAAGKVEYERWIVAKTDLKELRGIMPQRLIHEYQSNQAGDGIVMRSTFTIPAFFDFIMPKFSRRLAEHAQQEMQFLPYFLPGLYQAEWSE